MKEYVIHRLMVVAAFIVLCIAALSCARQEQFFSNPILAGFYPDPSICRVDDDYYLVNSTFAYFPGVPIFHSKDLVNWTQIGHVLDRPEQLNLDSLGVSRGIFAPTITYHNGIFYMLTTLVDGGGNFVVTAGEPAGPWSNPVWLPQVSGIDPSLFVDDDGKAYVIYNGGPPGEKSLYNGHRALWMYEFDLDSLKTIGDRHLMVNGGSDISQEPVWIEGPHLLKKDGYYYIIAAEGGTGSNHSEVALRATGVLGPYTSFAGNPILTQRHLDKNREHPITSTGHADLVETQSGEWWSVFLGCRPYEDDFYNTGRETFLAPVRWEDGWPVINPDSELVKYRYPAPALESSGEPPYPLNGNFRIREDFDEGTLGFHWSFLRTVRRKWYELSDSRLRIELRPEELHGLGNPAFIARRQQHLNFSASVALSFNPGEDNETAGLVAFQNETHYYYLAKTRVAGKPVVQLRSHRTTLAQVELPSGSEDNILLKIEGRGAMYGFSYATEPGSWQVLKDNVDGKLLSTRIAGGFVGTFLGMYASSQGKSSSNYAEFDWFEYAGKDATF